MKLFHHSLRLSFALILLTTGAAAFGQLRSGENSGGAASQQATASGPSGQLDFQTDLFTGRFGYQVSMPLAPGRHGNEPTISLAYSSANDNGWCGVGWNLEFGYVQRETKRGVPVVWSNGVPVKSYDDSKGFLFSLQGKGAALINTSGSEYRAEIESGFTRFVFLTASNQWHATDTSGNKYVFGQASASRMSNGKSGWPSNAWNGTFRWALSRVETVLGDTIDYTYTNLSGTLYPLKVSYNGHTTGTTNTHTVDFVLGVRTNDVKVSYISGYKVEQNRRLDAIVHRVSSQVVWSNRLAYTQSPSTKRTLLASVTRFGTNLTSSLPPIRFNYTVQNFGFQSAVNWGNVNLPHPDWALVTGSGSSGLYADVMDMDGDGLPDRTYVSQFGPWTNIFVQHNNGSGFDNPISFGPLSVQTYSDAAVQSASTYNVIEWTTLSGPFIRFADMNGDGYPDRVTDPLESISPATNYTYNRLAVQLNNGTNFLSTSDVTWTNVTSKIVNPPGTVTAFYRAIERAAASPQILPLDMNGDSLADRVMADPSGNPPYTNYWVQFNTGFGFTRTNFFSFPYYDFATVAEGGYGSLLNSDSVRLIDMNGDGLPDRVMWAINSSTGNPELCQDVAYYVVEYGNGYSFESPVTFPGVLGVYLGCGGASTICSADIQDSKDFALRDITGDGLPDRIIRQHGCSGWTNWLVQINQGTNFAPALGYGPYSSQGQTGHDDYTAIQGLYGRLIDINGDNIPDHVMPGFPVGNQNYFSVELSKGPIPDLLNVVSNGIGGSLFVTYKPSTQYDNRESTSSPNARRSLPFPVQTVATMSVSDGLYPSNTTTYAYEGGMFDPARREFRGFARVTVADPLGLTSIHWFHQAGGRDNSAFGEYQDTPSNIAKSGTPFRVETIGTNGQTYSLMLNKVENSNLGTGRHFAFVSQTLSLGFPGSPSNYRATAQQFAYDLNTGNLTNSISYGEVYPVVVTNHSFSDVTGDTVYRFTTFAALFNTNILNKPQRTIVTTDTAGQNVLRESLFDYDGNTGNLTRQRDRMCSDCYLTNTFGYDNFNNRTGTTNEAGIITTTVYDSTYRTFPSQQTDGGTFTSIFSYDARSGKLRTSTDPKGLVTSNSYDVFFRLTETAVSSTPNGSPNVWIARYDYRLGMANGFSTNSIRVRKSDGVDTANGHETWTYSDGLGRAFQLRTESETNNVFRVTDTVYDKRGSTRFVSLPYFSTGTNYTKAVTGLGTLTEYDPIGRPNKITSSVTGTFTSGQLGTTTATGGDSGSPNGPSFMAYDDGSNPWVLISTDEENEVRKYFLDAYGRTNQIVEVTDGGNYSSYLGYNLAGDLTSITDGASNRIEYAYNDLGQMVAMADPNMGVWQYRRDYAGRLREQVDANNHLIRFNYDDPLGRVTSRQVYDRNGSFSYGVTNVYDSSDDGNFTVGLGQLYKVLDKEGFTRHSYDVRGRVLKTARFLSKNGNTYTNQFTVDDGDHITQAVYPNGGPTITNVYDTGGNLSQIRQVGGSNTVFYAARGFNVLGQLTGINFGNGAITTNDYYATSKRLRQIVTRSGTNLVQNLNYFYDRVSNLEGIADAAYTGAASASVTNLVYDNLHRLISLTRSAISSNTTFSYSAIGNITINGENGSGSYEYGVRKPHAVKSANGKNYAYDMNGNMLVRGNQRLAYDSENRLVLAVTASQAATFGYESDGSRLWKQGTNNLQVWIESNYEEKNGQILFHILANGKIICTFDKTTTNVFAYYHGDHLQSTAIETDRNGNRIQHYEYMAFGQDRFTESSTAFPVSRRYTSQVLDEDTGLYYYNARYYDPQLGRFVQPDTLIPEQGNPQSYNRYSYVLNNPLKLNDPSGHQGEIPGYPSAPPNPMALWMLHNQIYKPQPLLIPEESARIRGAVAELQYGVAKTTYNLTFGSAWEAKFRTDFDGNMLSDSEVGFAKKMVAVDAATFFLPSAKAGRMEAAVTKSTIAGEKAAAEGAAAAAKKAGPLPAGEAAYQLKLFPDEAYNRVKHYGRTPTAEQRASVPAGMEFDHNPTLVQHYYEGAGGGLPGFNLTQTERLQHSSSSLSGVPATPTQQRSQGAAAAAYSKDQKKNAGLK